MGRPTAICWIARSPIWKKAASWRARISPVVANCGVAEIGGEVEDIGAQDGYVFYHMQDTERAVEGGGLYFNYGVFGGDETGSLAIGHRVVEALHAVGLKPDWGRQLRAENLSAPDVEKAPRARQLKHE